MKQNLWEFGDRKVRRMWPDPSMQALGRARAVARGYRAVALYERSQGQALHQLLTRIRQHPQLREQLLVLDPDLADRVELLLTDEQGRLDPLRDTDLRFAEWGEDWQFDPAERIEFTYDDDDWIPTKYAEEVLQQLGFRNATRVGGQNWLSKVRARGGIKGFFLGPKHGFLFRVGDIRALPQRMNGRGWRRTSDETV